MAKQFPQICQLPRHLLRHGVHPARVRSELRALGDRRVHLPVCDPPEALLVVDEVQLRAVCCARLGRGGVDRVDLLLLAVPQERRHWSDHDTEVVGEHCVPEYGGLERGAVEGGT